MPKNLNVLTHFGRSEASTKTRLHTNRIRKTKYPLQHRDIENKDCDLQLEFFPNSLCDLEIRLVETVSVPKKKCK